MAGVSTASTAAALQHLLEAEGAVIHAALQARALPSMGGGVGMILTKKVPPGTTLARFPFCSMITARKARFNLAMAEVAFELHEDRAAEAALPFVPFTSRVWSEQEFESRVRSQKVRNAIMAKVEQLEEALDSTETIVCYIILMASLHGRWQESKPSPLMSDAKAEDEERPTADGAAATAAPTPAPVLRYTHENRWMRTWIRALPVQYDNLLELAPQQWKAQSTAAETSTKEHAAGEPPAFSTSASSSVPPLPLRASYTTSPTWLHSYLALARFRATALREQHTIEQRFAKCHAVLRLLRSMPCGDEVMMDGTSSLLQRAGASTAPDVELRSAEEEKEKLATTTATATPPHQAQPSTACTLGHFLWAFNTLMSRGFYYPEETWALMPYVDYFNYALDSNGTMFPQEDDPDDAQSLSSTSLSLAGVAPVATAAPRKQARRTGLRSARVGRDAIPLANYTTYEFQLVRPVHAAGEQVMLHYGAYSDVELLMWYGFTLRPFLLPTSGIVSADVSSGDRRNATDAAVLAGALSLLPPGLATAEEDDKEHTLLQTARALRVLLPQIVRSASRVAYYRQHIRPSAATVAEDEAEGEYSVWRQALHRAYRLPLSPLADAEGNYAAVSRGQTWLDELFALFLQTPSLAVSPVNDDSALCTAAAKVDAWTREWAARRWPLYSETAYPRIAKGCGLGALGLSPVLRDAITSSFGVATKQDAMGSAEQAQLVRGIAWAELYVNAMENGSAVTEVTSAPVSAAAAAYARIASVDQWALLRFLALESSDAELEEYCAFRSESE